MSPTAFALGIGFDMVGLGGNPVVGHATPGNYAPLGGVSAFTRADGATPVATYVDATGAVDTVAQNILRDSHHIASIRTVLLESSKTNIAHQSEFAATWTTVNSVLTAGAATSPDGTSNAASLVDNATNNQHRVDLATTLAAGTATFSVFGKYVSGPIKWIGPRIGLLPGDAVFDLSAGTISNAPSSGTAGIVALGSGWYRCWVTNTALGNDTVRVNLYDSSGTAGESYAGAGNGGLLWRAMAEQAGFPSSPIATTTASVTRAVDALTLGGVAGNGPATLFYRYWDLATAAWVNLASAYTFGAPITPPVDRAYSDMVVFKGTLTTAQCQAALGF